MESLGAKFVVSRAARDVHAKFLLRNGADDVVYPEKQLAIWTAIRYSADHILDYIELDEEHAIFEIMIPEAWVGKTVGELDIRNNHHINIMAFKQNGALDLSIRSDTKIPEGSTMLVLGSSRDIPKCFYIQKYLVKKCGRVRIFRIFIFSIFLFKKCHFIRVFFSVILVITDERSIKNGGKR